MNSWRLMTLCWLCSGFWQPVGETRCEALWCPLGRRPGVPFMLGFVCTTKKKHESELSISTWHPALAQRVWSGGQPSFDTDAFVRHIVVILCTLSSSCSHAIEKNPPTTLILKCLCNGAGNLSKGPVKNSSLLSCETNPSESQETYPTICEL